MKELKRIALFAAGIFVILALLDRPFRGGDWYSRGYLADRDCRIAGIQEEPEGQIEVLNVGDSLANVAVTPLELYRDFGITSYVMGRDLQKCTETYYAIRLAIRKQPIKVVLWEGHNLCKHQPGYEPYMVEVSEYAKFRSQFIKYHYVWKRVLEEKGIRKTIRVMVIGVPNVGKSTLINRLRGTSIAKTGDRPGVTKSNQWIHVTPYLDLMDTPGMLWPRLDDQLAARRLCYIGSVKDDVVDIYALAISLLEDLKASCPETLSVRFHVEDLNVENVELLDAVCRGRGWLLRGGRFDYDRCCNVVLDEFRSGKLGKITLELPDAQTGEAL